MSNPKPTMLKHKSKPVIPEHKSKSAIPALKSDPEPHSESDPEARTRGVSVSYTHLTLPTIYSV